MQLHTGHTYTERQQRVGIYLTYSPMWLSGKWETEDSGEIAETYLGVWQILQIMDAISSQASSLGQRMAGTQHSASEKWRECWISETSIATTHILVLVLESVAIDWVLQEWMNYSVSHATSPYDLLSRCHETHCMWNILGKVFFSLISENSIITNNILKRRKWKLKEQM